MSETQEEWAVLRSRSGELWRGPMSKEEAQLWVGEAEEDGFLKGAFVVGRRTVSEWRIVEGS